MELERKVFSGWAHITRAEDVPGCWVAYCPDFDVMSMGDAPMHAFDMVREAVALCLMDDLNRGLDPHERRAPDEAWEPLLRLFDRHTAVPVSEVDASGFTQFAVPLTVVLTRVARSDSVDVKQQPDLNGSALVAA